MVYYDLPGRIVCSHFRAVLLCIAGLKNAQLWQDSMAALGKFAAEMSNSMVQVSSQEFKTEEL